MCYTKGCTNYGEAINIVSGIPAYELELFYEGYDGTEPEDICPLCGESGVAEDAQEEKQ